jgi:hypothetical protein
MHNLEIYTPGDSIILCALDSGVMQIEYVLELD